MESLKLKIQYIFWTVDRWNRSGGDSETISKWKAEVLLNLAIAVFLSPLTIFAFKRSYFFQNNFILTIVPFALISGAIVRYIFLEGIHQNIDKFKTFSKEKIKKCDIFVKIFIGFMVLYFSIIVIEIKHIK